MIAILYLLLGAVPQVVNVTFKLYHKFARQHVPHVASMLWTLTVTDARNQRELMYESFRGSFPG